MSDDKKTTTKKKAAPKKPAVKKTTVTKGVSTKKIPAKRKTESEARYKKKITEKPKTPAELREYAHGRIIGYSSWTRRSTHGVSPKFDDPEKLVEAAIGYFKYVQENPVMQEKVVVQNGETIRYEESKPRPMIKQGLCAHIGIGKDAFNEYKKKNHMREACEYIENVMYEQKFTGATAGTMNQAIITRELGLAEQKNHTSSDGSMSPRKRDFNDFYKQEIQDDDDDE